MHERTLVKTLIEQVCDEMERRGLVRVDEIQLQVGEFSGIEPKLLESAFEEISQEYWTNTVRLRIEVLPLTASCRTCAMQFHIEDFRFVCPRCGEGDVEIRGGEELKLVSVVAVRKTGLLGVESCP